MDIQCLVSIVIYAISLGALCISVISLYFTRKSWLEAHRPIVTARVLPISQHNFALNLVLRNTGNRPAKEVKLSLVDRNDLGNKLIASHKDAKGGYVESCFQNSIPILENGREISANFGSLSTNQSDRTWKDDPSDLEIEIHYEELDGSRSFSHRQRLRLISVDSFGNGVWITKTE